MLLSTHGPAHSLGCSWLQVYEWICPCTNISFSLIVGKGLHWLLAHWVRMHFDWPYSLIDGTGQVCLGFGSCQLRLPHMGAKEAQNSCLELWPTLLGSQGAVSPCSHLLGQGSVYHLAPEAPLFRQMLMELKAFLEPPGFCSLKHWNWYPH